MVGRSNSTFMAYLLNHCGKPCWVYKIFRLGIKCLSPLRHPSLSLEFSLRECKIQALPLCVGFPIFLLFSTNFHLLSSVCLTSQFTLPIFIFSIPQVEMVMVLNCLPAMSMTSFSLNITAAYTLEILLCVSLL